MTPDFEHATFKQDGVTCVAEFNVEEFTADIIIKIPKTCLIKFIEYNELNLAYLNEPDEILELDVNTYLDENFEFVFKECLRDYLI